MNKSMYPNTTQVSNFIIDNQNLLTDGEFRVIIAITRKTVGWHKETDWLSYTQIQEVTGKSKQTISTAVNALLNKGLISRLGEDGRDLKVMPQSYRQKIYYTLNKEAVNNLDRLKNDSLKNDRSKNSTSTGLKSLPYKTNSNKTKLYIGKAQNIKNVENAGKTTIKETKKKNVDIPILQGQTSLLDFKQPKRVNGSMQSIQNILTRQGSKHLKVTDETPIKTSYQAYGLAAAEDLKLPKEYHARIIKRCKDRQLHEIQNAIRATNKKRIIEDDGRFKFFITCLNTGDNLSKMPGDKMDRTRQAPRQTLVS